MMFPAFKLGVCGAAGHYACIQPACSAWPRVTGASGTGLKPSVTLASSYPAEQSTRVPYLFCLLHGNKSLSCLSSTVPVLTATATVTSK